MNLLDKLASFFKKETPRMPPNSVIIKWAEKSDSILITPFNAHKWKRMIGFEDGEPLQSPYCSEGVPYSEDHLAQLKAKGAIIKDATFGLNSPLGQTEPTTMIAVQTGAYTVPIRGLKAKY